MSRDVLYQGFFTKLTERILMKIFQFFFCIVNLNIRGYFTILNIFDTITEIAVTSC